MVITGKYLVMDDPRMAPLGIDEVDDETRQLFGRGMTAPDGSPLNIFGTLAHHPKFLKRWMPFAAHVLSKSTLPARDRELLILRTGFRCASRYEWGQHAVIALGCDISAEEIERVKAGPDAAGWSTHDAALLQAADDLHDDARVGDAAWATLASAYSDEQLIDVVGAVGNYHLVAFLLNSLGVQLDEGVADSLGR